MATPTTLPTTPNMVPGNLLPDSFGTGLSQSEGINEIKGDVLQAWTKLGTGASTPATVGHVLSVTGAGATAYQHAALSGVEAALSADVLLNNTANFFDGPSVSLPPGTHDIELSVCVIDTAGAATIIAKLWDGTTVESSGAVTTGAANFAGQIALSGTVTVASTTTWKVSLRCPGSTNAKILAATPVAGQGNNASYIRGRRVA
jgi:hypothetical protein